MIPSINLIQKIQTGLAIIGIFSCANNVGQSHPTVSSSSDDDSNQSIILTDLYDRSHLSVRLYYLSAAVATRLCQIDDVYTPQSSRVYNRIYPIDFIRPMTSSEWFQSDDAITRWLLSEWSFGSINRFLSSSSFQSVRLALVVVVDSIALLDDVGLSSSFQWANRFVFTQFHFIGRSSLHDVLFNLDSFPSILPISLRVNSIVSNW